MPLSPREAFKTGFIARCVDAGLDRDQTVHLAKVAGDKLAGILGDIGGLGRSALDVTTGTALPLALLAPPLVGGMAGFGLAKATDVSDRDVGQVKNDELLDAYRTETDRLKRESAARRYASLRKKTGRMFM